jgi:nitrite reductase/ring-hydroxylating ferredoxin subunit
MSEDWHNVCVRDDVVEGEATQVKIGKMLIALFQINGEVYAINDICTHEWACMSDGFIEGEEIECPIHMARFNILTGKVLSEPASEDLQTYKVDIRGDDIYVFAEET